MISADSVAASRPPVGVMAEVIQALLEEGQGRVQDRWWLRERAEAAGLSPDDCGALEALRVRLHDRLSLLAEWPAVSWY